MTREQEISKVALEYANEELMAAPYDAFMAGAEWADEHPKRITYEALEDVAKDVIDKDWQDLQDKYWAIIKGNLERSLRAKFILKVCEWLKNYAHIYVSETTGDLNEDDLISDETRRITIRRYSYYHTKWHANKGCRHT